MTEWRSWWARVGAASWPRVRAVAGAVSMGDVLLAVGLGLIAWGFWDVSRPVALGVPGAVLVWYALPPRPPFIERPREKGTV